MLRAAALVCLLAGCGRLGFDLGENGDAADARTDTASTGDGAIDGLPGPIGSAQISAVTDVLGDVTFTLPAPSTPGSLLVVAMGTSDTANMTMPPGWIMAASILTAGGCVAAIAFLGDNPGGITEVTFTQPSGIPTAAQLTEWTGVSTTAALDTVGTASDPMPNTTQAVQTAMPATASDELALTVFCEAVNMPAYTGDAGWTTLGTFSNDAASPSFITEYKLGVGPGVTGATVTSNIVGKYAAAIATFRPQ